MQYRLGVDIGGTFTDFVAFDEANRELKAWKNLSTPRDPIEGVMTGPQNIRCYRSDRCDPPRYDGGNECVA
jgi:N-methylhydantoinase A/oxoprolinase/acetone carboxylase beta subunit